MTSSLPPEVWEDGILPHVHSSSDLLSTSLVCRDARHRSQYRLWQKVQWDSDHRKSIPLLHHLLKFPYLGNLIESMEYNIQLDGDGNNGDHLPQILSMLPKLDHLDLKNMRIQRPEGFNISASGGCNVRKLVLHTVGLASLDAFAAFLGCFPRLESLAIDEPGSDSDNWQPVLSPGYRNSLLNLHTLELLSFPLLLLRLMVAISPKVTTLTLKPDHGSWLDGQGVPMESVAELIRTWSSPLASLDICLGGWIGSASI